MNLQSSQQAPEVRSALHIAFPPVPPRPVILTVKQFAKRNPAFTPPALRNLVFKAGARQSSKGEIPGNGLIEAGAILRIGRKVLIDEDRFFEWIRRQNGLVQEPRVPVECSTPSKSRHSRRNPKLVCARCNGAGMDPNTSEGCECCRGSGHEPSDD